MSDSIKPFQVKVSRRRFLATGAALAGAAGLAGYLPERLAQAASASPSSTFDLSQVKHVVFLMQENRSFDHYFGTFPGVRGFSDPQAMQLSNGLSVFQQPDPQNPDGYMEPFHISTLTSSAAAVPSLSHDWRDEHAGWNYGTMDRWLRTHLSSDGLAKGTYTMGYYTQDDIPFHWALAQNFTILDNYHCSVMGPTYPNRLVWMTGTLDPQGQNGGPLLQTAGPPKPFTWPTSAEILYNAGYGVKLYYADSGAQGLTILPLFANFQSPGALPAGLYQNVRTQSTVWGSSDPSAAGAPANPDAATNPALAFEQDCANGTLPDVSWIFAGAEQEHPPALPALGAQFIASKLEALASNEDLWNSTVFILNYDENDGFFDHVLPPTPNKADYPEEFVDLIDVVGVPGGGLPIGAGFRVPCMIISPWTVGGGVYSEVSDHTSALLLLEKIIAAGGLSGKGGVTFPLVSAWRRATFGDFTGSLMPGSTKLVPASIQSIIATSNPGDMSTGQTIAQYVTEQTNNQSLPLPTWPGRVQTMPQQD
jgi:phospholipase C